MKLGLSIDPRLIRAVLMLLGAGGVFGVGRWTVAKPEPPSTLGRLYGPNTLREVADTVNNEMTAPPGYRIDRIYVDRKGEIVVVLKPIE